MADLIAFRFAGHDVPVTLDAHGEPWWRAKDVCAVLGIQNVSEAVGRLRSTEKGIGETDNVLIINEPGLYRLIFRSNKPEAQQFQDWVFHEVLPTLRKTGAYSVATATPPPQIETRRAELDYLRAHHDFLDDLGLLDQADKLLLADKARTLLISGGPALLPANDTTQPPVVGYFVAERVQALGYCLTRKQETALIGSLSKQIAAEYRSRYGAEPLKRQRYVDGAVREVNWYVAEECSWMDVLIQSHMAAFPGITRQPS